MQLLGIFTNYQDFYINRQRLFLNDFIFGIIFIFIFYYIVKVFADRYYRGTPNHNYLMTYFKVKVWCTIAFVLIYAFYYKGGDTFIYLVYIIQLKTLFFNDPAAVFSIIFNPDSFTSKYAMIGNILENGLYMTNESTHFVISLGFYLSFFCFNSYFVLCLFCSMLAFIGCWKIYITFSELYPSLQKQMAIACLFIPSVCFWSSGLLKDPICMFALGMFTAALYELFFKYKGVFKNIIIIVVMLYILYTLKVYILISYVPAGLLWIISRNKNKIKSPFIKAIFTPFLLAFGLVSSLAMLQLMASFAERYSFESIMRTAQDTQNWLVYSSQTSGSSSIYSLGNIEYTPMGMLKIFPASVNVALFRPYIWEAKKPMLFIGAMESLVTFFFTVYLLYKSGIWNTIKQIITNPDVLFCMVFSIIFAFAVGFTSFNFGALARYKIPLLPFYFIALFILSGTNNEDKQKLKKAT